MRRFFVTVFFPISLLITLAQGLQAAVSRRSRWFLTSSPTGLSATSSQQDGSAVDSTLGEMFVPENAGQDGCEGVYCNPSSPLAQKVLSKVRRLSSRDHYYRVPWTLRNGNAHTIFASLYRRTPAVEYNRTFLSTPDGGQLAFDLLVAVCDEESSFDEVEFGSQGQDPATVEARREKAQGGDATCTFVDAPELTKEEKDRPFLLLTSGLGGGSADTYVRSMAATASARGWRVGVSAIV